MKTSRDHNNGVIMSAMASQITAVSIVWSSVCWGSDERKHQSCTSLAFVRGINRRPVDILHKGPVTRILFLFEDVIMKESCPHYFPLVLEIHRWPLGPVKVCFDVFFDVNFNKMLNKQSSCRWWRQTRIHFLMNSFCPSDGIWRHTSGSKLV